MTRIPARDLIPSMTDSNQTSSLALRCPICGNAELFYQVQEHVENLVNGNLNHLHLRHGWALSSFCSVAERQSTDAAAKLITRELQKRNTGLCNSSCDHSERLPNFEFDENTRRIVQSIDVLWLIKNVIHRAFEDYLYPTGV
jgi:hypothetical protein